MAAISSNTNTALANARILWSSTGTWSGGVVPTIVDDVTVSGARTTINQSNIAKWTGTITITVASTTGFPSTGFFYTYTNFGDYVKVNYTGTTSTTFTGCSIDYTDPLCLWKMSTAVAGTLSTNYRNYGSVIANGYYVYGPSPIVTIANNYTANVSTLLVNNGGILNIEPGGNLYANNYITLRDGRFLGSGNTGNVGTITIGRAEPNIGYFSNENYTMSIINFDGGETKSYATLNTSMSVGNTSIDITPVQGTIEIGDEITVYDDSYANSRTFMIGYRDYTDDTTMYQDEGFDVVGKVSNTLYLSRRNGARANVVSVVTSGSQKILTVDKNAHLSQMNFKAGDKVVINNKTYTIDSVALSESLLAYYNFQTGSTLSDFLTDYTTNANWSIDAAGAYMNGTSWNALVHKRIWRREVIVEAEISPWSGYTYNSGTRGTDQSGILFNFDPAFRNGNRNNNDTTMTGYWKVAKDSDNTTILASRGSGPGDWMSIALDTGSPTWKTIAQYPAVYRIENRNHIIKAYINGEQVGERFDSSGGIRGLSGVYVWNSIYHRVKSITYKAPTQDLYITTTDTFNTDDVVYESGAEDFHWSGSKILKIASKIVNPGTHDDIAFNYRGNPVYPNYDANTWPLPLTLNGSTSNYIWFLGNHDFSGGQDYYTTSTTANTAIVVDLTKQQTFTHLTFTPGMDHVGSAAGAALQGVQILGSNDNSTYTQLYGPTNDTKYYCNPQTDSYAWYNQMGYYYVGSQTYRYVKFIVNGHNGSLSTTTNRLIKLGLFNFASNNYTITLNNASDFANGDIITVLTHAPYVCNDDYHHYQAVKLAQNPETRYHTANTISTIVNKVGNTLYLDRPINYGFIEGGESVVKVNRNFVVQGFYDTDGVGTRWQKPYFKVNNGTSQAQIKILKNVWFFKVGSSRISGSSWNRGIDISCQDYFNGILLDGISVIGYNNNDSNGLTFYYSHGVCRNGFVGNVRDYRPYYETARAGVSTFNMKITNVYRFRPESPQNKVTNYNEVAGVYTVQPYISTSSAWYNNTENGVLRRNNFHGIKDISGYSSGGAMQFDSVDPIYVNEYNRIYATNINAFNGNPGPECIWPVGFDIHAEHSGMRLSQYRNETFLNWYNTPSDPSIPAAGIKDFMRADYDIAMIGSYNPTVKRSDWDFVRVYETANDGNLTLAAFSVICKAAVTIQLYVEFEYRMPMRLNRIQGSSGNYGKLYLSCTQNGSQISGYPVAIPLPTDDGWVKYSTTITTIPAAIGQTAVFISRNSMMTFCDFRYGRAYVKTNNPESVYTLVNSFDFNKYFNLTGDKKHMMPISNNPNILKGVKF